MADNPTMEVEFELKGLVCPRCEEVHLLPTNASAAAFVDQHRAHQDLIDYLVIGTAPAEFAGKAMTLNFTKAPAAEA